MIEKIVGKAAAQPIQFAIGAGIVVAVVYFVVKHAGAAAVETAVGAISGNNALTQGTPYQDKGAVGTLAAAANRVSGGSLQSIGEALGGWLYDVTHKEYDPNSGYQSAPKTTSDGARATDLLWGRVGTVELRSTF
jgi:hypothetical protein